MIVRWSKTALVGAVAFFYTLVVFNNLTDYGSNYLFVHHVLAMDTTMPGNHGRWRALQQVWLQALFYASIIAWEIVTMTVCWAGAWRLSRAIGKPATAFDQAKTLAVAGLTLSLLMWLVAFLSVGGEWFLMWQSTTWNGQQAAFRMFTIVGIVLVVLLLPDGTNDLRSNG